MRSALLTNCALIHVVVLLASCADEDVLIPTHPKARFQYVLEGRNDAMQLENFAELQALLPFEFRMPSFLPPGATLRLAQASVPAGRGAELRAMLDEHPERAIASISVSDEIGRAFGLSEFVASGEEYVPPEGSRVEIGTSQGWLTRSVVPDRSDAVTVLRWRGCGLQFALGALESHVAPEELMRVAASTLEGCD